MTLSASKNNGAAVGITAIVAVCCCGVGDPESVKIRFVVPALSAVKVTKGPAVVSMEPKLVVLNAQLYGGMPPLAVNCFVCPLASCAVVVGDNTNGGRS